MSFCNISCCNELITQGDIWFLADIKNFTARKLYKAKCPVCNEDIILLIEKRISDDKIFINKINGIEAVKTLYRENKRKLQVFPERKIDNLYGWIYGVNVEIKNKKGNITQIRQYSSDFNKNKMLVRKIYERQSS